MWLMLSYEGSCLSWDKSVDKKKKLMYQGDMKTGNLITDSKNLSKGTFLTETDLGFLHNQIYLIGGDLVEQMELLSQSKKFDISGMCVVLNSSSTATYSVTFTTDEASYGWGVVYSNVFVPEVDGSVDISWHYKRVIAGNDFVMNVGARGCSLFHFFRLFTTG